MSKIPRGFVVFRQDAISRNVRDKLKDRLTIVPLSTSSFTQDIVPIRMYAEDEDLLGIPRGFFLEHIKSKYVDDFKFVPAIGSNDLAPVIPGTPKPGQELIIQKAVAQCQKNGFGGAIIEAKTGAGKTFLGLETARRLGHKTLVLVPTSVLAVQWKKEVEKFFPTWRVGWLQADKIDIDNKDVVVGTLQSAALKDYPQHVYEAFGTVVFDEIHRVASQEFSKALAKFGAQFLIGLTGTLSRADRAEFVFICSIGAVVSGMADIEVMKPTIYWVDTGFVWNSLSGSALDRQKPHFLKSITNSETRNAIIIKNITKAAAAGRNVLVLSERVAHTEWLYAQTKRQTELTCGIMVGTTKQADRDLAQEARIIFATSQLVGTGFNCPRLDTLIFATPIQEVTQPVGRVLRELEGKKDPLVLDFVDSQSTIAMILARSRRKRYVAKGWKMCGEEVFNRRKDS